MSTRLPPGWTAARLDELAASDAPIIYGILQPGPDVLNGVPYVRPTEIKDGAIRLSEVRRTSRAISERYSRASLQGGDLLLSIVGTIGKTAIVPPELEGGNITQSSVRIRSGAGTTAEYLRALLASPQMVRRYDAARLGTGVPRLNVAHVRELDCPVPPLAEQRRIVAKLEVLQARSRRAKSALDAVAPLLEQLRRSVLAAAFRGDLTADWRAKHPDVEPASALLARIRAERRARWESTEFAKFAVKGKGPTDDRWKSRYQEAALIDTTGLPRLPSGWCWTNVDSVGDVLLGRRRAESEYVDGVGGRTMKSYVRVANVKVDHLALDDLNRMPFDRDEVELYRLRPGDIVLSEGQSPERVGQSAVYRGGFDDLCIQATVHRFRAYETVASSEFAQLVFLHHLFSGVFQSASSQTVNIAHLTSERLRPIRFPVPPLDEQSVLVARVRAMLEAAAAVHRTASSMSRDLRSVERAILAKAFRGGLVPQDPADEPAANMLARLRVARANATTTPTAARTKRSRKV